MSFLITMKVPGDTEVFQKAAAERGEEFEAIAAKAKSAGALHHRFGIGDGFVLVIDEWDSVDAFMGFFTEPSMQEFIGTIGADTSQQPEMFVAESLSTPDQF